MISLLISYLIICLIFGAVGWIVTRIPLPQPFKEIALAVVVLIFALILIGHLLPLSGVPYWR